MIALLEGTIAEKSAGEVILMTGGVGFRLLVSMNTLATLPAAEHRCRLFTHLSVREDALDLYGFATHEERDMFRHLISVTGIGPKIALVLLGSLPLADLRLAILTGDTALLSRAQGVGKKNRPAHRLGAEGQGYCRRFGGRRNHGRYRRRRYRRPRAGRAGRGHTGAQGAWLHAAGGRLRPEGRQGAGANGG